MLRAFHFFISSERFVPGQGHSEPGNWSRDRNAPWMRRLITLRGDLNQRSGGWEVRGNRCLWMKGGENVKAELLRHRDVTRPTFSPLTWHLGRDYNCVFLPSDTTGGSMHLAGLWATVKQEKKKRIRKSVLGLCLYGSEMSKKRCSRVLPALAVQIR